jgi:hypothetical protein
MGVTGGLGPTKSGSPNTRVHDNIVIQYGSEAIKIDEAETTTGL